LTYEIPSNELHAQIVHSDIRFSYSADQIVVETGAAPGVASGDFPVDGFFRQFETNPGFASENDIGFGINPGDTIVYNVLDDLLFWNGSDFGSPAVNTQIRIENNGSAETLVHGASGTLPGGFAPLSNGVGQADGSGDFHSHVDFFLEPNDASPPPEFGAYGLKLSLSTSAMGIAESDSFFVAFNFGLDDQAFTEAVQQYSLLLSPSLAGDFDDDGDADGQDFFSWQRGEVTNPPAAADLLDWIDHYGIDSGLLVSTNLAVPEPSTGLIVLTSSVCVLFIRQPLRNRIPTSKRDPLPRSLHALIRLLEQ
jgi:hypothetical protein